MMNSLCSILLDVDTTKTSPNQKLKGFISTVFVSSGSAFMYYKLIGMKQMEQAAAEQSVNTNKSNSNGIGSKNDSNISFRSRLKNLPVMKSIRRYVPGRTFIFSAAGTAYGAAIANCLTQKYT